MENPVEDGGLVSRRPKNFTSRVFHCLLAVVFFILLILALTSLGTTAETYREIKDDSVYGSKGLDGDGGTCILYADYPCTIHGVHDQLCLSDDPACQFAITGGGLIALVALLLIAWSLFKAAAGFSACSALVVIDLVLVSLALLFGLASSGVISAGLNATCKAFRDLPGVDDDVPCCTFSIPKSLEDLSKKIYFYEPLEAAQVTSWAATLLLFVVMVMDIVLLVVYGVRRSNRRSMVPYTPQVDPPIAPPPYEDDMYDS